jgi:regulator of protease activity HflC (stomatin/prohibitin superfamily)
MNMSSFLTALTTIAWLVFLGALVLVFVRAARNRPINGGGIVILATGLIAIILTIVSAGLVYINPQERGVVLSAFAPNGMRSEPLEPGLHWIIPFAEQVIRYPISRQTYTMSIATSEGQVQGDDSITARTMDGQQVFVDASVIFAIDPAKVIKVHIEWQDRYANDLVRPLARGVIRDVVSQYGIEEVISSKRAEMTEKIQAAINAKLAENGLDLIDFVLRNLTFSPEYGASVEQKQIAEQQAQQAKFVVEQRRQEAEQARQVAQGAADANVINAKGAAESRLIAAEAEAKSLELIAAALKDKPDLLTYQYIVKLSPNVQVMFLPNNSPFLFPLPTFDSSSSSSPYALPTSVVPTSPVPTPVEATPAPTPAP